MGDQVRTLNVDDKRSDVYRSFIEGLRQAFGDPGKFVFDRPVLRPQAPPQGDDDWIDIVLRTSNSRLRLKLRRDSLYLDGFRNDAESQWFEFTPEKGDQQHLISGSTFLGFGASYAAMESAAGREDRLAVALGQMPLSNAVDQLSKLEAPLTADSKRTANSLLVVVQMTCEAIRMQWISDYLAERWNSNTPSPPVPEDDPFLRMMKLENSWGILSDALIRAAQDPNDFRLLRLPKPNLGSRPDRDLGSDEGIATAYEAAAVVGILLHRTL